MTEQAVGGYLNFDNPRSERQDGMTQLSDFPDEGGEGRVLTVISTE
jgi:hypothetical protein